jgi:hypothetical protein
MVDFAGAPQQHVILSFTLWLLVVPLLLGFTGHGLIAGPLRARGEDAAALRRQFDRARILGMATVGTTTGAALGHAIGLVRPAPPSWAFIEYLSSGARIRDVDASIALYFDAFSAVACVLACVVAFGVATWVATRPAAEGGPLVWAWIELALAGTLLSFLADGLVTMAIGWTLTVAASAWLAGYADPRAGAVAATRGAVAITLLAVGGSWLFCRFEGANPTDSASDEPARFMAVRLVEPPDGQGSSLTLASVPGALVYLDEARTPIARAPFVRVPVSSGSHSIRIHPGSAAEDTVLNESIADGSTIALVPAGPSLSFREITASIAAPSQPSSRPVRETGVAVAVLCVWMAAAWAVSAVPPAASGPLPLVALSHGATTATIGPFLLGRASALLAFAPRMELVLAVTAAAILVSAARALWAAASRSVDTRAESVAASLLDRAPARAGALLMRYEYWVVDAVAGAAEASGRIAAWVAWRFDARVLSIPGDAAAVRIVAIGRAVEPWIGVPLARVAWVVLVAVACLGSAYGIWAAW